MPVAINILSLALFGGTVYGLTRNKFEAPWGRWVAGGCLAVLMLILLTSPDDGSCVRWSSFASSC